MRISLRSLFRQATFSFDTWPSCRVHAWLPLDFCSLERIFRSFGSEANTRVVADPVASEGQDSIGSGEIYNTVPAGG